MAEGRPIGLVLGEASCPGDHRVDRLEVAGVRVEVNRNLASLVVGVVTLVAVVVLDVAGASVGDRGDCLYVLEALRALEFGEE